MKTWLARSAPLAVPVSFAGFRYGGSHDHDVHPLMKEVMAVAPRWRSLRLCDPAPSSFFSNLAEHALDNLEELVLVNNAAGADANIPFFGPTPRLWKLSLTRYIHVGMPWGQLTHLTLRYDEAPAPDIFLEILSQCQNLIAADIDMPGWAGLPPDGPRIPLNHLRTLMLKFYPPRGPGNLHFTPFLSRLSTPALQEVKLHLTQSFIWLERQFSAFQLRSPNITHLDIRFSSLSSGDLRAALVHAPCLTHLELQDCPQCIDGDLLRFLSYKEGLFYTCSM
jgi:hypothetical protein